MKDYDSKTNTAVGGKKVGALGAVIDVSEIASNIVDRGAEVAMKTMKVIYYCMLIFLLYGCRNGEKKYLRTFNICGNESKLPCNKLYVEVFSDLGVGVPGSDLTYDYLTDSSSFRLFIGKYDDTSEILTADIKGDSVIIVKSTNEGQSPEWQSPKILEKKAYSLKELKEKGKFE